ncbi:MAG: hypothetical protein LH475_07935 [Cryobacterium sp.]|uniref:hypothetical protein n=1 Tax=Cryobacterium sp. TaxID=1926290 RepID=UPI0022A203AD|nr:hypothetical protein [Cryobacterium sp.]MCY7404539.1 hypothetical protein [Cryobacterium sp.]
MRRADLVAAGIAAGAGSAMAGATASAGRAKGAPATDSGSYSDGELAASVWGGSDAANGVTVADPAFEEEADDLDIPDFLK